jgi:hypothetical protein
LLCLATAIITEKCAGVHEPFTTLLVARPVRVCVPAEKFVSDISITSHPCSCAAERSKAAQRHVSLVRDAAGGVGYLQQSHHEHRKNLRRLHFLWETVVRV